MAPFPNKYIPPAHSIAQWGKEKQMSSTIFESTITELHDQIAADNLTVNEVVEYYIERIETYDSDGPELNSVITLNPNARERAAKLDEAFAENGPVGSLHGIPILAKDQVSTKEMVTTYGSEAFEDFVPSEDATIVKYLRDAGAIILGKTNMPDWAAGFVGYSSVLGQTKNPYALDRDPGGSSAGTAAGVAANFATVGIGEDTGGSIRVPASCCNLYGLRPTTGLVSRTGLSPLVTRQDTAGPMARTVEDLARLFDVLTGFDPSDERSAANRMSSPQNYDLTSLGESSLEGARLGVLRQVFGDTNDRRAEPVTTTVEDALNTMTEAGAELVDPVSLPKLDQQLSLSSLHELHPRYDINEFLQELSDPPADSIEELFRTGAYHEALELFKNIADGPEDPTEEPNYWGSVAAQEALRESILYLLAKYDLDALVFPDVQVGPVKYADYHSGAVTREDYPVNTVIASQSSCPAISMPAGFTDDGLPVGIELLGQPNSEGLLLELAAGYERAAETRYPPESTRQLDHGS